MSWKVVCDATEVVSECGTRKEALWIAYNSPQNVRARKCDAMTMHEYAKLKELDVMNSANRTIAFERWRIETAPEPAPKVKPAGGDHHGP